MKIKMKASTVEILKGLEIVQIWLDTYGAKIINIDLEKYTITIHDVFARPTLQTKDISEIAKHFAKMTEDLIIEKIHDDSIEKTILCNIINNFREELKILRKLIK